MEAAAVEGHDLLYDVGHCLVVDDDPVVRVMVSAFLVKAGFVVRQASNGEDALQVMADDPDLDILITDLAMPGMSGAELIMQATRLRPNIKVLMMSGFPKAEWLGDLPPDIILLRKPFRRSVLISEVASLLGRPGTIVRE